MPLAILTAAFRSLIWRRGDRVAGDNQRSCLTASPWSPSLFNDLQHILRLAERCPSGRAGNDIRRAACELVEATSVTLRARHERMLTLIAEAERRRERGRSRADDPPSSTLAALADALRAFAAEQLQRVEAARTTEAAGAQRLQRVPAAGDADLRS
jgi:hypothetical protein